MVSGVRARGLPCDALLAEAGIAPGAAAASPARASRPTSTWRCSGSLIERLDDECLGFLSRPAAARQPGAHDALRGQRSRRSTRRCAAAARTFGLLQDDVVLEPVRDGALAGRRAALHRSVGSAAWPSCTSCCCVRSGACSPGWRAASCRRRDSTSPSRARPTRAATARSFRRRCSSAARGRRSGSTRRMLQQPVRRDEAAVRAFLADARAHVIVPRRGDELVSARVRSHLQHTQPAWPDLAATAEALHMSTSTLQRRLARDGTSFQSLKDELRRDTGDRAAEHQHACRWRRWPTNSASPTARPSSAPSRAGPAARPAPTAAAALDFGSPVHRQVDAFLDLLHHHVAVRLGRTGSFFSRSPSRLR